MSRSLPDGREAGFSRSAVGVAVQTDVPSLAASLIGRPLFGEALVSYCAEMTRPPDVLWPINKLFGQSMRYIVCFDLIGNYTRWRRDGTAPPTLTALQQKVPASARQVASFVDALRHRGYVIAEPGGDRRSLHLRPSPALLTEIARSPLAFLRACEHILPASLTDRIRDDEILLADWLGRAAERFHDEDIYFAPFPTIVQFAERDSGYPLLAAVMGANYAARSGSTTFTLPLTYAALAERFRVSRQHVGNLLIEARQQGWLSVTQGGQSVAVSVDLVREFEGWAASQMALYRVIAEEITARE